MLKIYTDASVATDGRGVATCVVVDEHMFIGHKITNLRNIRTSLQGELEGAIAAIKYTMEATKIVSGILYTDSMSLVNLVQLDLSKSNNKQALLHKDRLQVLQKLLLECNICIERITGHSKNHNPNKVVDLISNSVLRYERLTL